MKKITLTIGIPAYNEAENIGALLVSLNRQQLTAAVIEKVIVYSDASTDNTLTVVKRLKNSIIQVILGKKRMGKANAMNMIMKHTTSDILVILDADILIRDVRMIERLVEPIMKENADLASARVKEYWTKSKFEEILKISMLLKKDIFEAYKQGNNIYTCHGRGRAFSKKLYSVMRFTENIVAEDAYGYLYTVYSNFKYIFAKNANIHYRLPGTFKDHQKQSVRFIQSYKQLADEFGEEFIKRETRIPLHIVVPIVMKYCLKYPLTLFLYMSILIYMRIRSLFVNEISQKWVIAKSTKTAFIK